MLTPFVFAAQISRQHRTLHRGMGSGIHALCKTHMAIWQPARRCGSALDPDLAGLRAAGGSLGTDSTPVNQPGQQRACTESVVAACCWSAQPGHRRGNNGWAAFLVCMHCERKACAHVECGGFSVRACLDSEVGAS